MPQFIANGAAACLNLTRWSVIDAVNKIRCLQTDLGLNQKFTRKLYEECDLDDCIQKTYTLHSSAALWPAADQIEFFITEILNKTYRKRTKQHSLPAWKNVLFAKPEMRERLVRNNVVKLEVRPQRKLSTRITESAAYPLANLFSDIGGILGLYLGMSVLSLCELIESLNVIVVLVGRRLTSRRSQTDGSDRQDIDE